MFISHLSRWFNKAKRRRWC